MSLRRNIKQGVRRERERKKKTKLKQQGRWGTNRDATAGIFKVGGGQGKGRVWEEVVECVGGVWKSVTNIAVDPSSLPPL